MARRGRFQTPRAEPQIDRRGMRRRRFRQRGRGREPGDSRQARLAAATGLLMRLRRAKREDRLDTELRQIAKARLLIIDEFGYMPIDEEGSRLLFQVISDSYETRSVIYTTNIEFSGWGRVLGDKNMAAALIDRTVHHGRLVRFEGGSYRSEHALMTR